MLPLCLVVAFLLPDTQINPATNRKITAQNYCPPCQLGKLPSSKIYTDILAPVPKTSSNSVPQLIKSHSQKLCAHSKSNSPPQSILRPLSNPPHVNLPFSLIPPPLTHAVTSPTTPPSSVLRPPSMFYLLGIHSCPSLHTQPFL
jgi:hypothetical protein